MFVVVVVVEFNVVDFFVDEDVDVDVVVDGVMMFLMF